MRNLRSRRVLITGSAQGIGLETAKALAHHAPELILVNLRQDSLERAAASLRTSGVTVHTYLCDVTDNAAIDHLRQRVHAEVGPIQVLVNNAGIVHGGPFLEVPLAKHQQTFAVNTWGLVAMTYAFLPDLIAADEGHLVNIASAAGFIGLPYASTYASSKWSVIGFSESIRLELAALSINHVGVSSICPSFVGTGLFAGAKPPKTTKELRPEQVAAGIVSAITRRRPFVLIPSIVHLTPLLRGILPTRLFDAAGRWFGVNDTMKDWRGRGPEKSAGEKLSAEKQAAASEATERITSTERVA